MRLVTLGTVVGDVGAGTADEYVHLQDFASSFLPEVSARELMIVTIGTRSTLRGLTTAVPVMGDAAAEIPVAPRTTGVNGESSKTYNDTAPYFYTDVVDGAPELEGDELTNAGTGP